MALQYIRTPHLIKHKLSHVNFGWSVRFGIKLIGLFVNLSDQEQNQSSLCFCQKVYWVSQSGIKLTIVSQVIIQGCTRQYAHAKYKQKNYTMSLLLLLRQRRLQRQQYLMYIVYRYNDNQIGLVCNINNGRYIKYSRIGFTTLTNVTDRCNCHLCY